MCAAKEDISTKQDTEKNLLGRDRILIKALYCQHTRQDTHKNQLARVRNPIEALYSHLASINF